jgi:hypothetical protein
MANLDAILKISAKGDASGLAGLSAGIKGIQKAGEQANSALGGMGKILGSVTGGVLALGAGLSAAGVVAFAKGAIDAADNMRDLSQKTGASVEMLSKFGQAANMSGTSIDAVGGAMVKLSRGMAEAAATGKGPAAEALRTLGISAVDASGKIRGADQVMLEVSQRFERMPDGAQKAALAVQLFGKAGADMIPMLNEGRQAIEGLAATMSTEFADKADAYNDSLAATQAVFGQIGMEIASQLLPYLSRAVDWISKVGIGFRDYIVANKEPIRQTIETISQVGAALAPWAFGLGLVVAGYKLLTEAVKAAAIAQAALTALTGPAGWAKLGAAAIATAGAVWAINEATKGVGDSTTAAALEAQKLAAGMSAAATAAGEVEPPIDNAKQQQEAFRAAVQQTNEQYGLMAAAINATGQAIELNGKLAGATLNADIAVNNTAKSILQTKLGQARTEGEKMRILGQIMELELQGAKLQKDSAAAQIRSEVTIADLKRRSAWAELRKAEAAIATAAAHGQDTRQLRYQLELAKQSANAADREFIVSGKIADEKMRVADAQYKAMVYQARAAADAGAQQAATSERRVQSLSGTYLSNANPSGGSVSGQQYRTTRTAMGGSVTELVPMFAGGGYTGDAPRSGGLDGRGGFMAMLHPRETVIDHVRTGAGGGTGITIPIQTGPVYHLADGTDTVSLADFEAGLQAVASGIMGQLRSPAGRMALRGA